VPYEEEDTWRVYRENIDKRRHACQRIVKEEKFHVQGDCVCGV